MISPMVFIAPQTFSNQSNHHPVLINEIITAIHHLQSAMMNPITVDAFHIITRFLTIKKCFLDAISFASTHLQFLRTF